MYLRAPARKTFFGKMRSKNLSEYATGYNSTRSVRQSNTFMTRLSSKKYNRLKVYYWQVTREILL